MPNGSHQEIFQDSRDVKSSLKFFKKPESHFKKSNLVAPQERKIKLSTPSQQGCPHRLVLKLQEYLYSDFGESSTQGEIHLVEEFSCCLAPNEICYLGISLSDGIRRGFVFLKDFPEEFSCVCGKILNSNIKSLIF